MARIVDLSIYLENDVLSDPPLLAPKIEYRKHRDTLSEFMKLIPGTKEDDYPDREAAAAEWVHATTQAALTSMLHGTTTRPWTRGWEEQTVDHNRSGAARLVLQAGREARFPRSARRLRLHARRRRSGARTHRPPARAARHRPRQHARRIALRARRLRQCRLRHGARRDDVPAGARRASDGHRCLELGRTVLYTAKKFAETGDARLFWEGHKAGRDIGYCHLEKLHNLESLPGDGFTVCCFPPQDPRRLSWLDPCRRHFQRVGRGLAEALSTRRLGRDVPPACESCDTSHSRTPLLCQTPVP